MINVKRIYPDAKLPTRKHPGDAGADLTYTGPHKITIQSEQTQIIPMGIAIQLEYGTEGQIRPRSSLSKQGLNVHLGTIDAGYRGEIGVIIHNPTRYPVDIMPGDRIAQLVVAPVLYPEFREVDCLDDSERGDGGFGSTGR